MATVERLLARGRKMMKDRLIRMEMMRHGLMMEMIRDRLIGRSPSRLSLEELGGYVCLCILLICTSLLELFT